MDKVLVAQMGHVPRKTGATGTEGEQEMARSVAQALVNSPRPGWTVRIIGADPSSDSYYRGNAFVAIHGDGGSPLVNGASVGYQTIAGHLLADKWKEAYRANGWTRNWHPDNYTDNLHWYYGVRRAVAQGNTSAIVIEVGFMTNPADRKWIDNNHAAIAKSIWDAVAGPQIEREEYMIVVLEDNSYVNRFWRLRGVTGDFLYTSSSQEAQACLNAGYVYEGVAWDIAIDDRSNVIPLYRLAKDGFHIYVKEVEKDQLVAQGWKLEGEVAKVSDTAGVLVSRLVKGQAHLYTTSLTEVKAAVAAGWKEEGAAFRCGVPKMPCDGVAEKQVEAIKSVLGC